MVPKAFAYCVNLRRLNMPFYKITKYFCCQVFKRGRGRDGGTKLERFLPKNQHTHRKCQNLTFKSSESYQYQFRSTLA